VPLLMHRLSANHVTLHVIAMALDVGSVWQNPSSFGEVI
jgi:hypothetical protein